MRSQWFELDLNELNFEQSEFLAAFCAHAPQWELFGLKPESGFAYVHPANLWLALDICGDTDCVLRTLRVDFTAQTVLCIEGELHEDDAQAPRAEVLPRIVGGSPKLNPTQCAEFAARWMQIELARPIELREWHTPGVSHKKYVLTDENRCVCWSDSHNIKRSGLDVAGVARVVRLVHPPPAI